MPATLKKLAGLQAEAGQKKEAAATLDRLNLHLSDAMRRCITELGDAMARSGESASGAIREYRAVLASKPARSGAGSLTTWRSAYEAAGQTDEAEEEVLAALEAAPGFKPAQKLLLELTAKQEANPVDHAPQTSEGPYNLNVNSDATSIDAENSRR